ncbi:hypothetical protein [Iamia sp.]|uniref:hypothetical protein n=1 Tax=Iamia sp. TaxID=2722710 RepID=UPI002B9CAB38|nr:hypothetical protein [Iamia sp.]HXH57372.1 hypothetical protein [Iamia sp.]
MVEESEDGEEQCRDEGGRRHGSGSHGHRVGRADRRNVHNGGRRALLGRGHGDQSADPAGV